MNKLQGKDLINVGIFTAIYFVVMMAIAMLGFIPIFLPLLIVLVPLIGGIVMMLYYSKVQKFGMVRMFITNLKSILKIRLKAHIFPRTFADLLPLCYDYNTKH